ncbi:MAG: CRTAC1 family protein, partial [Planctomycetota bacterium]
PPRDPTPPLTGRPPFENVSREAGITFVHTYCGTGKRYMVETNSSGVGWLDYDHDGYIDLYFVQGAPLPDEPWEGTPTDRLYRNRGDGSLEDVTEKAGILETGIGMGVACADFDGDGWADIYVCNYGKNRLYHNDGDGTFTDVTDAAGVGETLWSSSALFADFDLDSDLDLFVANYVDFAPERNVKCGQKKGDRFIPMYCHPDVFEGLPDTLYRNNGNGTFTDVSEASGIRDVDWKAYGKGLGVAPCDYDNDGDFDIFVANDGTPNFLFRNEGALRFTEIATETGVAYNGRGNAESCMGPDWADVNQDGHFDLAVCNIQRETNTYWQNMGDGLFFEDRTYELGIGEPSFLLVGFSLSFLDFDNDGDDDLFVSNGHMIDNIAEFDPEASFAQPDHLFENRGPDQRFAFVSPTMEGYFDERHVGRACAIADYDNDGDYDIAISNMGGPGILVRNNVGQKQNWIGLVLRGRAPNRDAIGARLTVHSGDLTQRNEVRGSVGLGSFRDLRLLFGLGPRTVADGIEIRWPTGKVQELRGLRAGEYHEIVEPE